MEWHAIVFDESFGKMFSVMCPLLDAEAEDGSLTVMALGLARPHVWRLAMIYALIDGVDAMTEAHLRWLCLSRHHELDRYAADVGDDFVKAVPLQVRWLTKCERRQPRRSPPV